MGKKKKLTREQLIKRGSMTLGITGAIYVILNLIPLHSIEVQPFYDQDKPLIIAHQGGEHLAPSSTMPAFQNAVDLGVDVLETDIHISKDGHLIAIHDPTVDRTTDGTGAVNDLELIDLKALDAGYYWEDEDGEHPYRGKRIELITVEELFKTFPDQRFMIEIKDTNPYERMDEISERLSGLINEYGLEDQVSVASFDHEIIETFQKHDDHVAVSAGEQEVRKFVITHKFYIKNLYKPSVNSMQLPLEASGYDLTTPDILDSAENMGLHIHYWTINDQDTMRLLIERGADGIITDRPDLLLEVLDELEY
ncbi:glycerophosphodiester phosphodiesterase [Piscibacillus halophilus]|uniref:glycerophosphodiester phosphodiesterase n=1 Tax=Piscibacillus halophilus TaxID=571933 RepID=UPI001FE4B487|nr:glycerophosphodiester phosphodiesterase [Piscibacillus halophilus]